MTNPAAPTVDQVVATMTRSLNGHVPPAIQHAVTVMPEMVVRHAQDSAFAMPPEGGALSNETRTLIYLGIALATGSSACIEAMTNKAQGLGIESAKLLLTDKLIAASRPISAEGADEEEFEEEDQ